MATNIFLTKFPLRDSLPSTDSASNEYLESTGDKTAFRECRDIVLDTAFDENRRLIALDVICKLPTAEALDFIRQVVRGDHYLGASWEGADHLRAMLVMNAEKTIEVDRDDWISILHAISTDPKDSIFVVGRAVWVLAQWEAWPEAAECIQFILQQTVPRYLRSTAAKHTLQSLRNPGEELSDLMYHVLFAASNTVFVSPTHARRFENDVVPLQDCGDDVIERHARKVVRMFQERIEER